VNFSTTKSISTSACAQATHTASMPRTILMITSILVTKRSFLKEGSTAPSAANAAKRSTAQTSKWTYCQPKALDLYGSIATKEKSSSKFRCTTSAHRQSKQPRGLRSSQSLRFARRILSRLQSTFSALKVSLTWTQ
jgi:hypothetical protein